MKQFGFIRVATGVIAGEIGNPIKNSEQIYNATIKAYNEGASLIVFPELCLSSYSCEDLFFNNTLLETIKEQAIELAKLTSDYNICCVIGLPVKVNDKLYNCAAFLADGEIKGFVPKTFLPNYSEFYEYRWFSPSTSLDVSEIYYGEKIIPIGTNLVFKIDDAIIGVEICEDLWANSSPSQNLTAAGANIICNLSASNSIVGKKSYREMLTKSISLTSHCAYVYCSAGITESTTDTLYLGHCIIAENGTLLANEIQSDFSPLLIFADIDLERISSDRKKITTFYNKNYCEKLKVINTNNSINDFKLKRKVDPTPFIPSARDNKDERLSEIFNIQALSLSRRIKHTKSSKLIIGVSGGLDSTLALLVAVKACDILGLKNDSVMGVTMPGFGTTNRTLNNAKRLMASLKITTKEIDITLACRQHFKNIGHDENEHDITYENAQARIRTQTLLDLANKHRGIVVGTGDLSELALGFATFAGDHISMYGVNSGVPKTLIRHLVNWQAKQLDSNSCEILLDILDTPISPELIPPDNDGNIVQQTEKVLGDYLLHDFFLYYFVRFGFSINKIKFLSFYAFKHKYKKDYILNTLNVFVKRFFSQQFKRSCLPDGPKIGSVSLSPRTDWKMPSDCSSAIWQNEV